MGRTSEQEIFMAKLNFEEITHKERVDIGVRYRVHKGTYCRKINLLKFNEYISLGDTRFVFKISKYY